MRTGSEHSPVNTVRGPTFLRSEIAKIQFVLAHICTGRAIWWSGSSTGSSNAGASLPDMTNSPQTTLPSSSSQPFGFGYALMSPRPSSISSRTRTRLRPGPKIPAKRFRKFVQAKESLAGCAWLAAQVARKRRRPGDDRNEDTTSRSPQRLGEPWHWACAERPFLLNAYCH
jgi:hypothetical protein